MAEKRMNSHRGPEQGTGRAAVRRPSGDAAPGKRKPAEAPTEAAVLKPLISGRWIASGIYLILFLVFLMNLIGQKGFLLNFLRDLVCGLFGEMTFLLAIPSTLYLSLLYAFNTGSNVKLRARCTLGTLFLIGCIAHIFCRPVTGEGFFQLMLNFYKSGVAGESGGLLCGAVGGLMASAFSAPLAVLMLVIAALICVISSFGLTLPRLIEAYHNRPRFEDDKPEPVEEPDRAAQLVNTITVKKHELRQQMQQRKLTQSDAAPVHLSDFRFPWQKEDGEPDGGKPGLLQSLWSRVKHQEEDSRSFEYDDEEDSFEDGFSDSVYVLPEEPDDFEEPDEIFEEEAPAEPANKKVTAQEAADSAREVTREIEENLKKPEEKPVYEFPSIELLNHPPVNLEDGTDEMRENSRRLNETLASFKIDAHVTNVTRGPSVTRYEVELQQGVRLSKLTSIADDISLNLGLGEYSVRIAPVPNKISVVGIEVPNQAVTMVMLRDVLSSDAFRRARSSATFAVGKDIGGQCIVGNITKLPHMLIAGTTGSGKSVCMNTIILSILFKASPDDVRLIMIDPKMVELGIYNGIPHLLIPVVTDPKKAAGSLQWAVTEMMRRYKLMSEAAVRDIESYNEVVDSGSVEGEHMAQVVVIIDELADLMLVAAKEVEESICRIAQMGRAAGVHLIIATQRPSADVITGLMKANIPSRIAFQVSSGMESRIILDSNGAEKLVGKGDMLYAPIGCGKPVRVQGCFVSDAEVESVTSYIKDHYSDTYDEKVLEEIEQNAAKTGSSKSSGFEVEPSADEAAFDEMLIPAVDAVLAVQQASVSMLQRKLKLGFSRAARIVDTMEELGIVGEHAGSKPRQILITPDQWAQMKISLSGGQVPQVPESDQMTMEEALEEAEEAESDELD